MKAAVLAAPGELRIEEAPIPRPTSRQALIQVEYCGVCASNLPRWEGRPWFEYPTRPGEMGHEGVGRIMEIGADVSGWEVGERVTFLSNHAYAGFDVANADEMVRMPDSLAEACVSGEPLACAWNIFRRADIQMGDDVAIVGVGFMGALAAQLAINAGARVIAIVRRHSSETFARALGVADVVTCDNPGEAEESISRLTNGRLCDVVVETTGHQVPLDIATRLTRVRGRLVIAGYHQDGSRTVDMQMWNWRGVDVVNAHERDPAVYVSGMRRAIAAALEGIIQPQMLISHRLPLEDLGTAFELAVHRPQGFVKAVVLP